MTQRMDLPAMIPAFYRALVGLETVAKDTGIDPMLFELIKIRASQINGCAFCLDMHLRDARTLGEDQRRLDVLSAWREAPALFSESERAALALAESVTRIADSGVPDEVWNAAADVLGEEGIAQVLMVTIAINSWNRLAVAVHQDLPDLPEHE